MRGAPALTTPDKLPDEEALAAFIGSSRNYEHAFRKRRFNYAAALAPFWLGWRKLVAFQVLSTLLYIALVVAAVRLFSGQVSDSAFWFWFVLVAPYVVLGMIEGAVANPLLRGRARGAWRRIRGKNLPREQTLLLLRSAGGTSLGRAIAVPGLALLSAVIIIPRLGTSHNPTGAYVSAMKADLRNLVTAEEAYFADSLRYAPLFDTTTFYPSTGVVITIGTASATGWSATARHTRGARRRMCSVFVGNAPSPVAGANEGEPKCT